jgi:ArsR family transcriptional regulator, arsenate/arsenite/antimonite-responsive transcriptional repressor
METTAAVDMLGALAQETRLSVFRLLVQYGPDGLPAGKIGEQLGIPAATLSFHLAQLTQAGLLRGRRQSRSIFYAVDFTAINALVDFMTENCCGASSTSCAPPAATRVTLARRKDGRREGK